MHISWQYLGFGDQFKIPGTKSSIEDVKTESKKRKKKKKKK